MRKPIDRRKRAKHSRDYLGVGTVRIRKSRRSNGSPYKVRFIKVAFKGPGRWRRYATYLWEQAHGPLPPGKMIIHLDGDPLNDCLSNLAALSPGEVISRSHKLDPDMSAENRRGQRRLDAVRSFNRELAAVRRHLAWLPNAWYAVCHGRREIANVPFRSRRRLYHELGEDVIGVNGAISSRRLRDVEARTGVSAVRGSELASDDRFVGYKKIGNRPVVKKGV